MVRHSQTVFYIERLQPDWLPGEQRWAFRLLYRLVAGLGVGLVAGLVVGLISSWAWATGWSSGWPSGWAVGLVFGLGAGLLRGPSEEIICAETVIGRGQRCQRKIWSSV